MNATVNLAADFQEFERQRDQRRELNTARRRERARKMRRRQTERLIAKNWKAWTVLSGILGTLTGVILVLLVSG